MLRSNLISTKNDILNLISQVSVLQCLTEEDMKRQIEMIVSEINHIALDLDKSINETDSIQAAINGIISSLK